MSNNSSDFKKLKAKWYAKLKKAGFEDQELNENDLHENSMRFSLQHDYNAVLWEAKQAYYIMAEHFLNEYKFATEIEKVIWEYHTNALSVRDIATTLKSAGVKRFAKNKVHSIVYRLAQIMKSKYMVNSKDKDGH